MTKMRLKCEEFKYIQYLLRVWEINPNISKREQQKELRILTQLQKKFNLTA